MLAVAACGDDGGNNNGDDTCGDGQKTGTEQCDDGNTTNGDGCSSTCRNESSGPVCGDGVMSGTEECDDGNTTAGDGCSATCTDEATSDCGNGSIDANEDCDDGNSTANDGCSACNVDNGWTCNDAEPSVCTMVAAADGSCTGPFPIVLADNAGTLEGMAMGDTTGGTSHVGVAVCDDDDAGAGNDLVYSFTLTDTRDVTISTNDASTFDAIVRVTTAACMVNTEIPEFAGEDGCSDQALTSGEQLGYSALPAGTYFVHVDGYDATEAGAFTLTISAAPSTCGDGILDVLEACDDDDMTAGDGCSARCDVEPGFECDTSADPSVCTPLCGNGTFDDGEECEPTLDNMDICSATCTLVSDVMEAEPNDTAAQAQMLTEANHRIRGTLTSATDVDLYKFTLTQPAIVEFETYDSSDTSTTNYGGVGLVNTFDCYDANTALGLFAGDADVTMDAMAIYLDDNDGDVNCSYIGPEDDAGDILQGYLEPGTYIVRVKGTPAQQRYILDMFISPAETPLAGDLVINEYMADDGAADTNCDGVMGTGADTDDEFVELVNVSGVFLNINGVRIHDGSATPLRHTFAAGPSGYVGLLPGEAIVVWGGGAPACADTLNWFTASQGSLSLNNSSPGDSIIVLPAGTGTTPLVSTSYTAAAVVTGVSNNLNPDVTGTAYVRHNLVSGAVGNFSPGTASDGTPL